MPHCSPDSRMRWPAWAEVLVLAAILAVSFAMRWPFRHVILIRDEGEYAHLGQQILRGAIPYLQVYNQKTPFVFYVMAGIQALAGPDLASLRIGTSLYGLLATVVMYLLARRLFGPLAAAVTALAFTVMVFDRCGIFHPASTEFFMLLWIALSLYLWYWGRESSRGWLLFLAGAAAGLAYQTKQTGSAVLMFLVLEAVWSRLREKSGRSWLAVWRELALAAAGFAAVFALVLAYFAAHGAAGAYLECTWTNNTEYVGRRYRGVGFLLETMGKVPVAVAGWDVGLWIAGVLGLAGLAYARPARQGSGLWILLVLTTGAALAANQWFVHYFEPMIVPLALGTGVAMVWLSRRLRPSGQRFGWRVLAGAALVAPWLWPAVHWGDTLRMSQAERSRLNEFLPLFGTAPRVAQYLAEHTTPEEGFLIVGSEPEIYFYAQRPATTRFVFTYPLTGPYTYAPRLRAEFLRDLQEHAPRYVLVVGDRNSLTEWTSLMPLLLDPALQILRRDYTREASFTDPSGPPGLFAIYRRKDATSSVK